MELTADLIETAEVEYGSERTEYVAFANEWQPIVHSLQRNSS